VDGSAYFLKRITDLRLVNVQVTECLFENFAPTKRYDYIFATFILEHVNDPVELLRKYSAFLSADGLLFIVVPNARALSRQLARHMGLLPELTSLTDNDVKHGHRLVYDRTSLNSDIKSAGLLQLAQGGILLKPFADFQMDRLIEIGVVGDAQADGLFKLGLEYPDLSGSLFSICRSS